MTLYWLVCLVARSNETTILLAEVNPANDANTTAFDALDGFRSSNQAQNNR